uniref:Aliphatic amidase n=1 Tax=Anthurium amnicola TaxID=1678845 RepID=A0A1D1XSK7_9ARAE
MDPCPFVRVLVGNLALKIPVASKPARSGVHPSSSPCYCKIRLGGLPCQTAAVPLIPPEMAFPHDQSLTLAAGFQLNRADLGRMAAKPLFAGGRPCLTVAIYTGCRGTTCGVNSGRLLGRVTVSLDLKGVESRPCVFHNGWVSVGKREGSKGVPSAQVHLTVRADPDPRFVFEFGGDPESSPQVFQVQGNMRQPVFTCKFSCRNSGDRTHRSRSLQSEPSSSRSWLSSFGSERERPVKERKGWSVTVHDLSGSPVALASMVTPFVASPGSDRVSRSNPGAWLVLRPGDGTWKPWGRLEAWRVRGGGSDVLGFRFELLPEASIGSVGVLLAESTMSTSRGGKFTIDLTGSSAVLRSGSPGCSPRGSGDFGFGLYPFHSYRGFVMSSTVEGEGKKSSRPTVEVGVQQVGCTEDAAAFVALAAAIDLSMDACRLFSHKLKKELSQQQDSLT